jgi:NitT/TauT family transport system permease protein
MKPTQRIFAIHQTARRLVSWGDLIILAGLGALLYFGLRLGGTAPRVLPAHEITLAPRALPLYAALSIGRMSAAYMLSVVFSLVYGGLAARNRPLEKVLLPTLDVLQSVPILSFLPVVLLSLSTVLPQRVAAELASIVLIFTSQAWNMTFSWYQSLTTIPKELHEASAILRFGRTLRFTTLLLPFGLIGLIWNSMMGWAGGWFFLMAAEMFAVGERNFRLPGLGAYLQEAANQGDAAALTWGIGTLILVIVLLDQLVWRPLLAWSDRFKLEMVEGELPPTSWFLDALQASRLLAWVRQHLGPWLASGSDHLQTWLRPAPLARPRTTATGRTHWALLGLVALGLVLVYALYRAVAFMLAVTPAEWGRLLLAVGCTLLRVAAALALSLLWTLPVGVAIGTNRRLAAWLQPVVQIAASLPATALFPALLLLLLHLPGGLNFGAVLLMLMGTQWYLLFNIIAGASAIPQDLKYTAAVLQLSRFERWRTLILPALFPFLVTGAIAASGGAWNASIVAEYAQFGGRTMQTLGIGATIASATAAGHYPLLYAATLGMILTVVAVNRFVWRRLYRVAESRYRLD